MADRTQQNGFHSENEVKVAENDEEVERTQSFVERALQESQRMRKEVTKSHDKIANLHAELGAGNFAEWRAEHSAEVLSPQEQRVVEHASIATDLL